MLRQRIPACFSSDAIYRIPTKTVFIQIIVFALLLLWTAGPAASQDGRGVVIEPSPQGVSGDDWFNPQLCGDTQCQRLAGFLYPTLLATDPATNMPSSAATGNYGLVVDPTLQEGNVQTLKLRDDLTWSDGVPITAYDVLYSYLNAIRADGVISRTGRQERILGARVVDEHTIAFQYASPDCSSLPRSNFRIIPYHTFQPNFIEWVEAMNGAGNDIPAVSVWFDAHRDLNAFNFWVSNPNLSPEPTAGIFTMSDVRPNEDIRLVGGNSAFVYRAIPDGMTATDLFLSGKANVLINPPLERRDDIRATPGLQVADMPSGQWDAIVFNMADPNKPKSAFDDQGNLVDQGHHPLFSDVQVRRAVQMAIDVHEIIEVVFHGNATPMASSLPPTSWAFNPGLKPSTYDPIGAEHLLESAGWKDVNGDGVRECHGCLYGQEGMALQFSLGAEPSQDLYEAADLIAQQLRKVGFIVSSNSEAGIESQQFDAHLTTFDAVPDPDQSYLFSHAADILNVTGNNGSYYNEQIEALLQQARSVPGCEQTKRADLYRQIQTLLQDDQPYAWLYARNDLYVAQGGVSGFAPYAGNPFWNIRDWVVTP